MNTKKSKKTLKWLLYVLFAVVLFCLQNAPVKLAVFSSVAFLLPFAIAFASFEGVSASMINAILCGFFWDYSAQREFGFHALILCVLCVVVTLAMKFFVRPVFLGVFASVVIATVFYFIADYFFFFFLKGYEDVSRLFFSVYIPSIFKTVIFGAGICLVVKKIYDLSPNKAEFDL